jgi:hypothetical protein
MARTLLILVFAAFGAYSTYAMFEVGYLGIWRSAFKDPGSTQVLLDLCISLGLVCSWMLRDARERGRNAWPFVVAALFVGSVAPLLYLLLRLHQPARDGRIARQVAANMIH